MAERKRKKMNSVAEGEYLINQFFFKVYASEKRPPVLDQKDLQRKYLDVMLHEYTHYLHEVSMQIARANAHDLPSLSPTTPFL
jgi:hypothetical protein